MGRRIVDLSQDRPSLIEQTAQLLFEGFRLRTNAWPDLDAARQEVHASLEGDRISRALVRDLEHLAAGRGALTLWTGSDDENQETSLGGVDLYADVPGAIRNVRNLKRHPYEFYVRLGFVIVGVMPDANGRGRPDIFLAKRIGTWRPSSAGTWCLQR